jgi:hypothetical protein
MPVEYAMSRQRIVIIGVVLAVVAAQVCCAQPLPLPKTCPMKTRCCRMLPAPPTDAIRPDAPQVAVVASQPLIPTEAPALPVDRLAQFAPAREVPTRTVQLRI